MGLSNTSLNYLNYPTQVRIMQTKKSVFVFVFNGSFVFNLLSFSTRGMLKAH